MTKNTLSRVLVLSGLGLLAGCAGAAERMTSGIHFVPAKCEGSYRAISAGANSVDGLSTGAVFGVNNTRNHVLPQCEIHVGETGYTVRIQSEEEGSGVRREKVMQVSRSGGNAWSLTMASDTVWRLPKDRVLRDAPLQVVNTMSRKHPAEDVFFHDDEEAALFVKALRPTRRIADSTYVITRLELNVQQTARQRDY